VKDNIGTVYIPENLDSYPNGHIWVDTFGMSTLGEVISKPSSILIMLIIFIGLNILTQKNLKSKKLIIRTFVFILTSFLSLIFAVFLIIFIYKR